MTGTLRTREPRTGHRLRQVIMPKTLFKRRKVRLFARGQPTVGRPAYRGRSKALAA